jgi:parallel beta-helix repeat protein
MTFSSLRSRVWWGFLLLSALMMGKGRPGAGAIGENAAGAQALPSGVTLYVAPQGDDRWSGRQAQPTSDGRDGPVASLHRALQIARQLRQAASPKTPLPVTIVLRGGTYFLTEPVLLTPQDSGSADAPLRIEAYPNERPILSGGRRIAGWKAATLAGQTVWQTHLADVQTGQWNFRQLWVNGQRARRARHPNQDVLRVAELPDVTKDTPWNQGQKRFRFRAGDLPCWPTMTTAEVVVFNRWVESRLPIARCDEKERLLEFHKRSVFRLDPGDPYYVEHCREALDAPGEWFLDRFEGRLEYIPRAGEEMTRSEVIAPLLPQVVRMVGDADRGRWVEHVHWQGITFAHTEWYFPEASRRGKDVGGFAQAAVEVPGAVFAEATRYCTFDRCTFTHLGTYALELGRACSHNRIRRCSFSDLGAGGIKMGETTLRDAPADQCQANEVVDCTLRDGGHLFPSAVGIWIGQSAHNRIAHCEIADFYYTGISIGWTWGYGRSLARGNIVEYNHVHHIGKKSDGSGPWLSDMGGIYTLGVQPGTTIRNNLWHDIAALRYGGWGIYFDEGSSGILAENNLVYNTTHGGFHQHYGRDNTVQNNIFAWGRDHALQATRPEEHIRFRFVRNIVLHRGAQILAGNLDFHFVFDHNLYWRVDGDAIRFGNLNWEQWQAKGMDRNSIRADPQFRDPARNDFRLAETSPARQLGFQPFSLDQVGPRPDKMPGG